MSESEEVLSVIKRGAIPALCAVLFSVLVSTSAGAAEWYERIKVGGDVRVRGEAIKIEYGNDDSRARIRARLRVMGEVTGSWSAGLGLATGSDDPVSTNVTLTGGFANKGLMLDLAYIDYHPKAISGLHIVAGKMHLPFETAEGSELQWDHDLTPEGFAARYRNVALERVEFFANGALFEIRDTNPDDLGEAWMIGGQAGLDASLPRGVDVTVGAAYYNYEGAIGNYGFYRPTEFYGNTWDLWAGKTEVGGYPMVIRGYAHDFNVVEALGVVDGALRDWVEFTLYGTYVNNIRADDLNVGWLAGGSASRGRDAGAVKLYANYRRLEPDAVIGIFTDSDFAGGGTDCRGWELGCVVGAAKGIDLRATWFLNMRNIRYEEFESEYRRLQVDVQAAF